ncbi:MAG: ATP-binding protein, partial [Rhodobacteraceae bacterium]|nr:ATP-binding protein [Paracoccaceae bacterium]
LARQVPGLLKNLGSGITVTRFQDQLISIEPGDTASQMFGLAFDIGTTTIVGYLADLTSGEVVAAVSGLNPQSVFGGDLISRIAFGAAKPANVRKLHSQIVTYLNDLSKEICAQAGIVPDHVYKVTIVGNTCMHHLFLGIDPTSVGHAPYLPVIRSAYDCSAREAGLRLNREARLFMLPLVAGFVGADTVGVILSTGIDSRDGISVVADIGTNAEVVMKCPHGLFACSSPAGPALEGGQIHDGMRAALGAVDRVTMENDIRVHTIGEVPALGICGSGLIDTIAALLEVGIIAPSGRLLLAPKGPLSKPLTARLRKGTGGHPEFVLVWAKDSSNRNDIVLTQGDIRQFQLAKAAILGGVVALADRAGVAYDDISEFMLAGGFGNFLDVKSARRVGLIPDLATSQIHYISNAAGLGAQLALISDSERIRAGRLADTVTHISLAGFAEFQKMYLNAMAFPKTVSEKP